MATAGMRLLPEYQQKAVLRETCSYLRQNTDFALPDCDQNVQIISGETEGLFGWLAANYLLGGFDNPEDHQHGKNHNTYGFLDMGGASAQIAFAPNATEAAEHADVLKLVRLRTLNGKASEHRVFTATWLGFGVNQARETYVKELTSQYDDVLAVGGDIPDPCMPKGLRTTLDGTLIEGSGGNADSARGEESALAHAIRAGVSALVGTGEFSTCLLNTKPILAKDKSCGSESEPCLIHDAVPSIDFDINHFIGVSEYYHSTHGFFGEEKGDIAYDFNTYQRKVQDFCTQDWTSIRASIMNGGSSKETQRSKEEKADRAIQDAEQACFKASWVINVLHEGIGIPRVGLEPLPPLNASGDALEESKSNGYPVPFRPVDKIDGTEVSWTLGRMLLYSAGQIPPYGANSSPTGLDGKGVAVGFGSNVKDGSIPADFTYAGSMWEPFKGGSKAHGGGDDDDWGDAAEDLLDKAREKSAMPGALFMLLIIILFAWLLRRKDRRTRFFNKAGNLVRRTGLFGSPRKQGRFSRSIGTGSSAGSGNGGGSLAGLAKRLFRRNSHEYERVLEEGNLSQFELADMDDNDEFISDSSEGSASAGFRLTSTAGGARTSGLSTPTGNVDRLGDLRPSASVTNVASFSAIDRSGLVVRTESRERLGGNAGRRSRAASPTRLKSAMAPMQSE